MKIWNAIKNVDWEDVNNRAFWTFLQAFLACFILAAEPIIEFLFAGNWSGLISLSLATLIAGISAGLSAAKTVIVEVITNIRKEGV